MCSVDARLLFLAIMTFAASACAGAPATRVLDAEVEFDGGRADAGAPVRDADQGPPDARAGIDASADARQDGACRACAESELRFCYDGEDSDCDGLVDCGDPDCDRDPDCARGCTSDESGLCVDAADNDCDGLPDCRDPDCRTCAGTESDGSCSNTFDDDCDGLLDCRDPDCAESTWCTACHSSEIGVCHDGIDDDGDGSTDCEDVDCARDLVCTGGVVTRCPS